MPAALDCLSQREASHQVAGANILIGICTKNKLH
jgi:hypothetical protein